MQIRPITDLRNTTEISDICNKTGEPIFITKNGYGDLVVMSLETYEKEIAATKLYKSLADGLAQARKGELLDGDIVLAELRKKYAD
jgi:prevent-host-death family protein